MNIEFEHKKSSLMSKTKEELAEQVMRLEHNNNVLHNTIDQQAENFAMLEEKAVKEFANKVVERLEEAHINCFTTGDYKYNNAIDKAVEIVQSSIEGNSRLHEGREQR